MGRLKSTIYARMEEMSFRSGALVVAGVLAVAGVAITLAVALGGHGAAATSTSRTATVARSTPPPSPVLPAVPPSATAQATPVTSAVPADGYQLPAPATAATTPRPSASSSAAGLPTPRHPRPTPTPAVTGQPVPINHNPGGLNPRGRGSLRGGRPHRDGEGRLAGVCPEPVSTLVAVTTIEGLTKSSNHPASSARRLAIEATFVL